MRHSGKPLSAWSPRIQAQIVASSVTFNAPPPVIAPDLEKKVLKELGQALAIEKDRQMIFVAVGIPQPAVEHRFDRTRRWRFDYAWPDKKVALEVEGGVWTGGRHTSGAGFMRDMEKYNRATVLGWRVLRCTPETVTSGATLDMLLGLLS